MKTAMTRVLSLVTMLLLVAAVSPTFAEDSQGLSTGAIQPGTDPGTPNFALQVDPISGKIHVLSTSQTSPINAGSVGSKAAINGNFNFISATCVDCGTGCPPTSRQIDVVLQANTAVTSGYGVGNISTSNATMTNATPPAKTDLNNGDFYNLSIVTDVINCGSTFGLFFDVCQPSSTDPGAACP